MERTKLHLIFLFAITSILSSACRDKKTCCASSNPEGTSVDSCYCGPPIYGDLFNFGPTGFCTYYDYDQSIECSKKTQRPILIQFTGHACYSTREMAEFPFNNEAIAEEFGRQFILLQLYCDDKTVVDSSDWVYTSEKTLKTIGKINYHRQTEQFKGIGQPYVTVINNMGQELTQYLDPVQAYSKTWYIKKWLRDALTAHQK